MIGQGSVSEMQQLLSPPTTAIDWEDVGFGIKPTNGHVQCRWREGAWSMPEFVTNPMLNVHGLAPGLNYGQQCFEGLKAFRAENGEISIFRPGRNAKRMAYSAGYVSMPEVPEDLFLSCCRVAVAKNAEFVPPYQADASLYVRPLLFGSGAMLGLSPSPEYMFCVYVLPVGAYHGVQPVDALVLEDFDRSAPHGSGGYKVGGNYSPCYRHTASAVQQGFGITLHLDALTHTFVDEFSTSGFVGIRYTNGQTHTMVVPQSPNIIESVTTATIMQIAKDLGWTVEHRPVPWEEVSTFSEVIAAGTAALLLPIKSITRGGEKLLLGGHEPGPAVLKLTGMCKEYQMGALPDIHGWRELVTPADEARL